MEAIAGRRAEVPREREVLIHSVTQTSEVDRRPQEVVEGLIAGTRQLEQASNINFRPAVDVMIARDHKRPFTRDLEDCLKMSEPMRGQRILGLARRWLSRTARERNVTGHKSEIRRRDHAVMDEGLRIDE